MFRSHQQVSRLRRLFDTTVCPCCLKDYHTYTKIKAHVRYFAPCREHLASLPRVETVAPGQGSRQNSELEERYDRLLPIQQAAGPHREARGRAPLLDIHFELEECILTYIAAEPYSRDACVRLRALVKDYAVSWTQFCGTLRYLCAHFTEDDEAMCDWTIGQVRTCLGELCHPSHWTFLTATPSTLPTPTSILTLQDYEAWCIDLYEYEKQSWAPRTRIPRVFGQRRVLLHAFSGRRRPGDLQWFLELLDKDYLKKNDFQLDIISLDIVIDPEMGDVVNEDMRAFWLAHIKSRHVVAFLGGPPCNTWSTARENDLGDQAGPRVVRRCYAPWGLNSLRRKELLQVLEGNQLMGFSLESMSTLATTQGIGLLEHPARPEDPTAATIWAQPLLRLLLDLPGMRLVRVQQGYHGAASRKPTDLLALNVPTLEVSLKKWAVTQTAPCQSSIGKDDKGHYRTAPLKEYPPSLCGSFAEALLASMDRYEVDFSVFPPSDFICACDKLRATEFGSWIGPDSKKR
eukprot:Skav209012  [mRNA]  locus=scaffold2833:116902:118449:- [translate_table: standard]